MGAYTILDKVAQVTWQSNPYQTRFGEVALSVEGKARRVELKRCELQHEGSSITAIFHPLTNQPTASLRVTINSGPDDKTLEFKYDADSTLAVESIRLLDQALWTSDADKGYLVVPVREGMLIPADNSKAFEHRFDTYAYEGCHMEMFGVVKQGAAALVTWDDPYIALDAKSVLTNAVQPKAQQIISPSLVLRSSARSFRILFSGPGDYVSLAKAYREIARQRGYLVAWDEKLKKHPQAAKLFGAINFKLWSTLSRQMNSESTQEVSKRVNWTFDEAARVAEHLHKDLKLERVLFIMGGWIRRGYDNQHPDILPAAIECGGNAALSDCSRRVRSLGYLLSLHDNYQDIYRDSPSWDEKYIMKNRDGSLMQGGAWAGGRAYLTCSQQALELAKRPQNLAAVQLLTKADAYFIDTTYAAGLQECFDKNHPLTRADDMKWKQAISDYARDVFGLFGSECGREWAIPHSDFFEGLTGVSGHYYHDQALLGKVGGVVVPLFEIVYRDTMAMYGKYGYNINRAAEYVLYHISIGRPLNYHSIPSHLYWQSGREQAGNQSNNVTTAGDPALFTRAHQGWAEGMHGMDRFVKNTYEILSPLNELTAQMPMTQHQFLSADRKVQRSVFGSGATAMEVIVNAGSGDYEHVSQPGGSVKLPPFGFLVESPYFVAFHASSWKGFTYEQPVLFTLQSQDHQPWERSKKVRVFHAFGDPRIQVGKTLLTVPKEVVVEN